MPLTALVINVTPDGKDDDPEIFNDDYYILIKAGKWTQTFLTGVGKKRGSK